MLTFSFVNRLSDRLIYQLIDELDHQIVSRGLNNIEKNYGTTKCGELEMK